PALPGAIPVRIDHSACSTELALTLNPLDQICLTCQPVASGTTKFSNTLLVLWSPTKSTYPPLPSKSPAYQSVSTSWKAEPGRLGRIATSTTAMARSVLARIGEPRTNPSSEDPPERFRGQGGAAQRSLVELPRLVAQHAAALAHHPTDGRSPAAAGGAPQSERARDLTTFRASCPLARQPAAPIQSAIPRPISSGESSWT